MMQYIIFFFIDGGVLALAINPGTIIIRMMMMMMIHVLGHELDW